jgi:hypothetical protein
LPLVLDEIETLIKLRLLYIRWRALGRPMTLNDLLNSPAWLIDGLLTLDWISQKVNKKKE